MKIIANLLIAGLFATPTFASEPASIAITRIGTDTVTTPLYQSDDGDDTIQVDGIALSESGRKKWLRLYTEYTSSPRWIDGLTLEFYLLVPSETQKPTLFKGTVSYANIPKGRNHLAEMYMHFNATERYGKGRVIDCAVVAVLNGKIIATKNSRPGNPEWFKDTEAHSCKLLNREQTPFRIINPEDYQALDR